MNNNNGALDFESTISYEGLVQSVAEIRLQLRGLANSAEDDGRRMDSAFGGFGKTLAGLATGAALLGFGRQLVTVTGQFQQLDVAFTTMLGSKDKANKLMAQVVDTAAKTPFTLTEVASGAKQLLAYQVAAEDVNNTLIRLGNISSGLSVPLDRLILAYGQVKAKGKLMGDDMRQLMEAGLPVNAELAKVMTKKLGKGVDQSEIAKMAEAGQIKFDDLDQVIKNLTNDGGMFFNLMEKQSKTMTGQISNLEDAWDRMLNKIGQSNDTFISGLITGTTATIENYQEIIDILVPIIAAYGAYKAAIIATAAIEKAMAASKTAQMYLELNSALGPLTMGHKARAAAIAVEEAAQGALNKTMLANPYALALAAVTGLAIVIYKLATATTKAEEAHKELDAAMESETLTLDIMFARFKNAKQGTEEYTKAKDDLISKYGQYDSMLAKELETVEGMAKAYKNLSNAVIESAKARLKEKYTKESSDAAAEAIGKEYSEIRKKLIDKLGTGAGSALFESVKAAFETGGNWKQVLQKAGIDTKDKTAYQFGGTPYTISNDYSRMFNNIRIEKKNLQKELDEFEQIFGKSKDDNEENAKKAAAPLLTYAQQIKVATKAVEEAKANLKKIMETPVAESQMGKKAQDIEGAKKAVKEAQDQLALLTKGEDYKEKKIAPFGSIEYWSALLKKMKDSVTQYDSMTGKAIGSTFDKQLNVFKKGVDITKQLAEVEAKVKALSYKSFDEEIAYKKGLYDQYYTFVESVGKEAADKQYKNLLAGGESYTKFLESKQAELLKIFNNGDATNEQLLSLSKLTIALNDARAVKSPFEKFQEELSHINEESRTVTEYLEKMAKLKNEVSKGKLNLNAEESAKANSIIDTATAEERRKMLIDIYNNYRTNFQQMEDLQKKYNEDAKALDQELTRSTTKEAKDRAKKAIDARKEAYSDDTATLIEQSKEYRKYFGDISEVSLSTLNNTVNALRLMVQEAYDSGQLTYDKYAELMKKINSQQVTSTQGKGFEALFGSGSKTGGVANMMFGEGDMTSKMNSFTSMFKGAEGSTQAMSGNMSSMASKAAGAIAIVDAIIKGIYQTIKAVTEVADAIADLKDSYGQSTRAQNIKDWTSVANVVNEGVMGTWNKLKSGDIMGSISQSLSMPLQAWTTLNKIHDSRIERDIQKHKDAVEDLKRAYNDLERAVQNALGSEVYGNQVSAINNLKKQQQEYVAMISDENRKKKTDQNKIKEYQDQIKSIQNSIEDTVKSIREDIMGGAVKDLADSLGDAMITAFAKGEDAAAAWGDKVNDIVGGVVKKMLIQKLVEEPVGNVINKYISKWVDKDGNFIGFDTVMSDATNMGTELTNLSGSILGVLNQLPDSIKQTLSLSGQSSLSGAISATITEETATLLSGYINAIRINQLNSINIMNNMLIGINIIANNTAYNKYLENIDRSLAKLSNNNVRAMG